MNVFVFDIETVPDLALGRRLLGLENEPDKAVAEAMMSQAKEASGQVFVKHHCQKIVTISAALRQGDHFKIWSLGDPESSESDLIQRFFSGIEKYQPMLVSWNGAGFDLPVIHYRALLHGIPAIVYWECGERKPEFKYNNYLNRYHHKHLDLMDYLSGYQAKAFARLNDIALMLGLPGKMGMDGSQVLAHYLSGEINTIRDYCETDVLNTYFIFLRFQLIRGLLPPEVYQYEIELAKQQLSSSSATHLKAFLQAWEQG